MSVQHPKFRAAAVQAAPVFLDLDATIDKSIALIAEASENGADLIAFPETFVPGYPWFIWLDSPAWGMQFIRALPRQLPRLRLPRGRASRQGGQGLRRHRRHGAQREAPGKPVHGEWVIGPDGETIARRRKLKPTHVERTVFGEGDGSDLAVHDTALGRLGALCCWEHLQPLSKYAMYAQNEQVHVAAWPSFSRLPRCGTCPGRGGEQRGEPDLRRRGAVFRHRPVCDGERKMSELLCTDDMKKMLLLQGGGFARIYAPDGQLMHAPLAEDAEASLRRH